MSEEDRLQTLTRGLVATLRRDAAALADDGAPDLTRLADQLEELLAQVARRPGPAGRKALLQALDEVERFRTGLSQAAAATRDALAGADQRRMAWRAYGESERLTPGGGR